MALMLTATAVFLYLHFVAGLDASISEALRARANEITSLIQSPHQVPARQLPLGDSTQNFAQILDAQGRVLDASAGVEQPTVAAHGDRTRPARASADRAPRALAAVRGAGWPGALIVVVGESLAEHEHAIETLGGALLIGGPSALLLASLAA